MLKSAMNGAHAGTRLPRLLQLCDEHFETDLQNAYELGKRLVKKAEEHKNPC